MNRQITTSKYPSTGVLAVACHAAVKAVHISMCFAIAVLVSLFLPGQCSAQAVTWTQNDIGYTGATSSYTYTAGTPPTYAIAGGGVGIGGYDSNLTTVTTPVSGNVEIEGRVASQGATGSGAQAGFIMCDSFMQPGAEASISVTPGSGVTFYYRANQGYVSSITGPAVTAPVYLRLARSPNAISGYESSDGINWTLVGTFTQTNVMPNLFNVGMNVSSSVYGTLNTSVFDHVALMTSVPQQSSNLLQWLRADVGVTYAGGTVSSWADQSGLSNDATQSTTALQPGITTGAINNAILPTITFNGSSNYLSMPSGFSNFSAGLSIFVVAEPSSSSATGDLCSLGNASNNDAIIAQTIGTQASLTAYNGATGSTVTTTSNPLSTSQYQLIEETLVPGSSATGTIFVNGVQQAQSTSMQNTANTTRADNYIGAGIGPSNYFPGGIAEVIVMNNPVSASQRQSIESYVLSKYGVGNQPMLQAPTFTPLSSVIAPTQTVSMQQSQGATIYYTVDGSTPTVNSLWFDGNAITIASTQTVQAIAVLPFFTNSSVASAVYQADPLTTAIPRSGLIGWYRADNTVSTSGSNVTVWGDVSGSGNDASQSVSGDRPTLVANAINGLPAINFDKASFFL